MEKQTLYDRYCRMLRRLDRAAALFYMQDFYNGIKLHQQLIQELSALLSDSSVSDALLDGLQKVLPELMNCQEAGDYNGIAGIYKMQVRELCVRALEELHEQGIWQETRDYYRENYEASPAVLQKLLNSIGAEIEDVPAGYELVETQVGTYALRVPLLDRRQKLLLSSAGNPFEAAERLVAGSRKEDVVRYVLLGLEMGYTASALAEQEDVVKIDVYEHDRYVIKAAFHYMDLRPLLSDGRFSLIYDPSLKQFSKRLTQDVKHKTAGLIIHQPSVRNIADPLLRNKMEDFLLQENSIRSQKKKLDGNFYRNTTAQAQKNVQPAESLKPVFSGRTMLLLAGGPSLEPCMPALRQELEELELTVTTADGIRCEKICGYIPPETILQEKNEAYLIVCVGTVLKQVLAAGIRPDYVVMTDAQEYMVRQIEEIDTSALSLIYLPTLYYGVLEQWEGNRYLALQKGYEPSERLAQRQGWTLFETGGSVSTLALDLGLRMGCREIVCMGLDLAYTGGRHHAGERGQITEIPDCFQVPSVNAGRILTGRNLNVYRQWIERRIAGRNEAEQKTVLVNVSDGAWIEGMKNVSVRALKRQCPETL